MAFKDTVNRIGGMLSYFVDQEQKTLRHNITSGVCFFLGYLVGELGWESVSDK